MSDSLQPYGLQPARLLCPWDFPGNNTGVGCRALQGVFPTQESNPRLLRLTALAGGFLSTSVTREAFSKEGLSSNMAGYGHQLESWRNFSFQSRVPRVVSAYSLVIKGNDHWDLPGGRMAKTPCSRCRGPVRPWSGN